MNYLLFKATYQSMLYKLIKQNGYTSSREFGKKYSGIYIDLNTLIERANGSSSFKELKESIGKISWRTFYSILKRNGIFDKVEFVEKYMPIAFKNKHVFNAIKGKIKNHKVTKIEWLIEKQDTCDIRIKDYYNFATSAEVIIHNSGKATLASEDVRFARTIQRIQRIIASELSKIAIVHLYAQGYRDESLVDFELELTNPSTIFEKEKIEIWQDKVSVATDMIENKFFSYNWAYKNIFNMSEDDVKEVREEIVEDAKQRYRFTSIEEDGDDPAKPFKKIGGGGGGEGGEGGGGGLGGLGGGGGGGGGGKLPDLEDLEDLGGEKGGPEGEEGEEPEGPEETGPKKIKEIKKPERDQSGEHIARDQERMGEDPLGQHLMDEKPKKNSEGKKKSALTQNSEVGSPLGRLRERSTPNVDKAMISSLSEFLSKTHKDTKKELLSENVEGHLNNGKSLMDETNILE